MTTVKCPTCQQDVKWIKESEYRPFCSDRCKLIDLGDWADGTNAIAGSSNLELANFDEFDLPDNDEFFNQS